MRHPETCRVPIPDVRAFPQQMVCRLTLAHYNLLADALPNGMSRPGYVVAEGVLTLGSDFHLLARVLRPEYGPMLLEILEVYDTVLGRCVTLNFDGGLLRGIFDLLAQAHVTAKARQHARSAVGKN